MMIQIVKKTRPLHWLMALLILGGLPWLGLAQTEFLGGDDEDEEEQSVVAPPPPPPLEDEEEEEEYEQAEGTAAPGGPSRSDVILLMDVSGSMESFALGQNMKRLDAAKKALSEVLAKMQDETRFQLWTFSEFVTQYPSTPESPEGRGVFKTVGAQNSKIRQNFINVVKTIEIPRSGGNVTNLYAALFQAIQYYNSRLYQAPDTGGAPLKVVVVLSDGQDDLRSPVKLGTVMAAKMNSPDVQIKTIGFGIKDKSPFYRILCRLATEKNCALAQNSEELQKVIGSFTAY